MSYTNFGRFLLEEGGGGKGDTIFFFLLFTLSINIH